MKEFEFEDKQLKTLLLLASQDIDDPDRQVVSFGIIRTVIMRKLMTPEVYDVMDRVGDLAIRGGDNLYPNPISMRMPSEIAKIKFENRCSRAVVIKHSLMRACVWTTTKLKLICYWKVDHHSINVGLDNIRKQSRELFVHFLAHYPMAAKRLQQHLEFVLTHLGYEYEAGRLSALQLIHQVSSDFPEALVLEHAQFMFLPLVLRLVNDDSNKVMIAAAKTLQTLIKRLDKGGLDTVIDFCLRWFDGDKIGLVRAAAQVVGLVAETKSKHITAERLKTIVTALHKVYFTLFRSSHASYHTDSHLSACLL